MKSRLVMLGGQTESTFIVANALRSRFGDFPLIVEDPQSGWTVARRRARRLGVAAVAGQLLFIALSRLISLRSRPRIEEIRKQSGLDSTPVTANVVRVPSVNGDEALALLKSFDPELVVVNGTRILAPRVLDSIRGRFLNMHAGITPAFRGCHGGYWAIATGRPDLAGTTVHWIDRGIDTGPIVKQALIEPGPRDNFATYPYLQMAAGLPLLAETVSEWFEGKVVERQVRQCESAGSKRYDHPTVWEYLCGRLRGVK